MSTLNLLKFNKQLPAVQILCHMLECRSDIFDFTAIFTGSEVDLDDCIISVP